MAYMVPLPKTNASNLFRPAQVFPLALQRTLNPKPLNPKPLGIQELKAPCNVPKKNSPAPEKKAVPIKPLNAIRERS